MIVLHMVIIGEIALIKLSPNNVLIIVSYKIITSQVLIVYVQGYRFGVTGRDPRKLICPHGNPVINSPIILAPFQNIFLATNLKHKRFFKIKTG